MNAFVELSKILQDWSTSSPLQEGSFDDLPHDRLRNLLVDMRLGRAVGSSDIVALISHSLRYEQGKYGSAQSFTLPAEPAPWPSRELWERGGCSVVRKQEGMFTVRAKNWNTKWPKPLLIQSPKAKGNLFDGSIFSFADKEERRHPRCFESSDWRVPADPALKSKFVGLTHYQSKSQAETIREVLMSPPGSVRLIVLPTGSGKSLVGLSSALVGDASAGGVSIVVVPTIALAYDQVEQARAWNPGTSIDAWQSGLSTEEKKTIKDRLKSGGQRLLFAAPESVVGALKSDLLDLAQRGLLNSFIVDEAHLISQWGASFRPEFQTMSALWRQLRKVCPDGAMFRTLLMTATLTTEAYGDLCRFFVTKEGESLKTLAGVHLRPEPDYYLHECSCPEDKISKVIEVLRHAPRPAILYVTKVQDSIEWYERCIQEGWERVGLVHGQSTSDERERTVKLWRENKIDLMVATSAFGLGMDKGDVRLVLHACVPETIDRFYQEVGRGGRDGKASVSMMIYIQDDIVQAASMSKPGIIGDELGLARWKAMWQTHLQKNGLYYINLQALRPQLDFDGQRNMKWNLRTILLLARSGVISIECPQETEIPQQGENESKDAYQARRRAIWETERLRVYFKLIGNNPMSELEWERSVGKYREGFQTASVRSWANLRNLLNGENSINEILHGVYRVPEANINYVPVRAENLEPGTIGDTNIVVSAQLKSLISNAARNCILVTYPIDNIKKSDLGRLWVESLKLLARHGICEFALPSNWTNRKKWLGRTNPLVELDSFAERRFVVLRDIEEDECFKPKLYLPRLSFITPDIEKPELRIDDLTNLERPQHVIFLPESCQDPHHPSRVIDDTYNNLISIHTLINKLNL